MKKAREFIKDANRDFVAGRIKKGGCVEDYVKALGIIEESIDRIDRLEREKEQLRVNVHIKSDEYWSQGYTVAKEEMEKEHKQLTARIKKLDYNYETEKQAHKATLREWQNRGVRIENLIKELEQRV